MRPRCSVIIPVYNRASLTQQCLNMVLSQSELPGQVEIIVVDDGSTDWTPALLHSYGDRLRTVIQPSNRGFASSCNAGAAVAQGDELLFLNNDTLPVKGWLTALLRYLDEHPAAAIVGSKLLFPNGTIQHAGVTICQDRYPRHIYAGLPADHPAVCHSRRFQIVTGACLLVRRPVFEAVAGFDQAFVNGYEDVDLCLRIGEQGHEVHYCCESVLYHLESVSRSGRIDEFSTNNTLFRQRWASRVCPDDISYYLEDGLMRIDYWEMYPFSMSCSPLIGVVVEPAMTEIGQLLNQRARQSFELLRRTIHNDMNQLEALAAGADDQAIDREPTTG